MTSRAPDSNVLPNAGDDRRVARLLAALAEAPDFDSAASFLLTELSNMADGLPAAMLRFTRADESLVFVSHVGFRKEDAAQFPEAIEDREHPAMIAALALSPVVREQWDPLESTCRHASLSIL